MKKETLAGAIVGGIVSIAIIAVTVYYAGTAWRKSQAGEKLI